jgi:hypothetical protein
MSAAKKTGKMADLVSFTGLTICPYARTFNAAGLELTRASTDKLAAQNYYD